MHISLASLAGAVCLSVVAAANAESGNIIINGGFENGLDQWTVASATLVTGGHGSTFSVRGHCRPVNLSCFDASKNYAQVGQVLSTTPGASYTLSFWTQGGSSTAIAEIAVRWDGVLLDDHLLFTSNEYTQYVFTGLTSSSAATPLKIYLGNHNVWAYTHIDDISVTGEVPQVPEPGMAGMLLAGLGAVAYAARRRARTADTAA